MILLIQDVLLTAFMSISVVLAWRIQNRFDFTQTNARQYRLERLTYLVATIIRFVLSLKIAGFIFFVYSLDQLSHVIPGAMCAVGVTNASAYGIWVFFIKLLNLYLFGFWLLVDQADRQTENYRFTTVKFRYFGVLFALFVLELLLQYLYLADIDPQEIVSCCGTVFNAASTSLGGRLMRVPRSVMLPAFYVIFLLLAWTAWRRDLFWAGILNIFFLAAGIMTLIAFFSTYVYELPQHQCPFCLLQRDYYYVGYLMYALLLSGTFFGTAGGFLQAVFHIRQDRLKLALLFNTLFVVLCSAYPLLYYFRNGVWL